MVKPLEEYRREIDYLLEDCSNYIKDTNIVYTGYMQRRFLANEETDPIKRREGLDKAKKLFNEELKKLDR